MNPGESEFRQTGPDAYTRRWVEGPEARYVEHELTLSLDEWAALARGEPVYPGGRFVTRSLDDQLAALRAGLDQRRAQLAAWEWEHPEEAQRRRRGRGQC